MGKITIGIRADGSAAIGMGHLMRCLSIAIALKEQQAEVIFITGNEQSKAFIIEKGFGCKLFQKQYESMENETAELISILKEHQIQLLLVDSYYATETYLAIIKAYVPVFYMDDLGRMNLPVSGLINYNIYGQYMAYEQQYSPQTELILGPEYAPIKPEFLAVSYDVRERVTDILVTMGGSDALNIAGTLGEALLETLPQDVNITVICGRFSPHLDKVKKLELSDSRFCVLTDVTDMWNQMAKSDLAIAAAGSTMYELCTIGVPAICCYYVENQRRMAECFGKETSMLNAGDYSKEPDEVLELILQEVSSLIKDYELRKRLSAEMKALLDGKGAKRIAEKLCKIVETK